MQGWAGLGWAVPARPGCVRVGMCLEREEFGRMFMVGHLLFPWVCGNKSWIKEPQPAWWGSTWDADYPEREPRGKTPTAFNRRRGKTSRDPLENGRRGSLELPEIPLGWIRNCWPFPTRLGKVTAHAGGWEGFAASEQR